MTEPAAFLALFAGGVALLYAIAAALEYRTGRKLRGRGWFMNPGASWWSKRGWRAEDRKMRKQP